MIAHFYSSSQQRDWHGRFGPAGGGPEGHKAYQLFSPNIEEGLKFDEAASRLRSDNQAHFRIIADDIMTKVGLKGHESRNAIGDWADGAENSLVETCKATDDFDRVRYAAVWMGKIANQKAVVAYQDKDGGPDAIYEMSIGEKNAAKLRGILDQKGVAFRTIVPTKDGHDVIIFDKGKQLRDNVAAVGDHYDVTITEREGQGDIIGADTRTGATREYDRIIKQYEKGGQGSVRPRYRPESDDTRRAAKAAGVVAASLAAPDHPLALVYFDGLPCYRMVAEALLRDAGVPISFISEYMRTVEFYSPEQERDASGRWVGLGTLRSDAKASTLPEFLNKYAHDRIDGPRPLDSRPHEELKIANIDPFEADDWSGVGKGESPSQQKTIDGVAESVAQGKPINPVLIEGLSDDPKLRPMVVDGHHRVAGHIKAGADAVPAVYDTKTLTKLWKAANGGRKVAVLGLAGDPIHTGHVALAKHVRDKGGFDEVWMMPAHGHAFGKQMAPADHRLDMVKKAVANEKGLIASDFEMRHKMDGRAINTVERLQAEYPQHDFSWVIAQDNANDFNKWHRSDELSKKVPFVVVPRPGVAPTAGADWAKKHPHTTLPAAPELEEISSTSVRTMLKAGAHQAAGRWLHPDVLSHIRDNDLYGGQASMSARHDDLLNSSLLGRAVAEHTRTQGVSGG